MRAAPPAELESSALIGHLETGWGIDVAAVEYAPVGGGSFHWIVTDRTGTRSFLTGDDLGTKPWFSDTWDGAYDGLRRAFGTAAALRGAGLQFVAAPITTTTGETLQRIGRRYSIALFPFVAGQAGRYGEYDAATRAAVVTMLAELHRATPVVSSIAKPIALELPGGVGLQGALGALNERWTGGPFSARAQEALARHASDVAELLGLYDRLSAEVAKRDSPWVVTHGEPHAANVISNGDSHVLVDWDTVALAPPERDLWILVEDTADEAGKSYAAATGHPLDRVALDLFRLRWDLADIAALTNLLRSEHREDDDTAKAYRGLAWLLTTRDRWEALL